MARAVCLGSAGLPLFGGHVWVGGHQFGTSSCFTTTRGDGGPQKFCNPGQTGPAMCLGGWRIQISGGGSGSCPGWGCLGVDMKWPLWCHMFYYWLLIGCFGTYCFGSRFVVYSWARLRILSNFFGLLNVFFPRLLVMCVCRPTRPHSQPARCSATRSHVAQATGSDSRG